MRIFAGLLFFLSYSFHVAAQNFEHYQPLQCSGEIPEDFTRLSGDKFKEDKSENLYKDYDYKTHKAREEFLLKSNFSIDNLLFSGRVTFNDPISSYVKAIAHKVLENEPELKKELRFYTIKSSYANAFTTDQGIIFITTGLIAQLENEAQLAYVLCHEIAHYTEKHVIDSYVENRNIVLGKGQYRHLSYSEEELTLSSYSKELELSADSLGFLRFKKTPYDLNAMPFVFDVLHYSYLPFDEIEFDQDFFDTKSMHLSEGEHFLDSITPITINEDYDDSRSSHPNIDKRKKLAYELIGKDGDKKGKDFLLSSNQFLEVRDIARFELVNINLAYKNYAGAIYNAYLLLKKYPDNHYLETSIAKAMYGYSIYKNQGKTYDVVSSYKDKEGQLQQVHYLLYQLEKEEANTVALAYVWKMYKKYGDEGLQQRAHQLMRELIQEHDMGLQEVQEKVKSIEDYKNAQQQVPEEEPEKEEEQTKRSGKYSKIESRKKEITVTEVEESFHHYAFMDLLKEESFVTAFDSISKAEKADAEEREKELSYQEYKKQKQAEKKKQRKGVALGIDNVVAVDPLYVRQDKRSNTKLINSENKKVEYTQRLTKLSEKAELNLQLLDSKSMSPQDITALNNMFLFKNWLSEKLSHDEDVSVIPSYNNYMGQLIEQQKTPYFMYSGVVSSQIPKHDVATTLLYTTIIYPLLPLGIYYALRPQYETLYFNLLFDLESGKMLFHDFKKFKQKDGEGLINSHLYNSLLQIKSK